MLYPTYICAKTYFVLYTSATPEVVFRPTSQDINPGDQAVFNCSGSGEPMPVTEWFLNDMRLNGEFDAA